LQKGDEIDPLAAHGIRPNRFAAGCCAGSKERRGPREALKTVHGRAETAAHARIKNALPP
jgi:hypothetical protein